jgi:energy-coupling factor transporter ATP-binding protein EcfA2
MGAGCSNLSADDKKAAVQSRAIDKELAQAKKKATKEVKLLLLGAGASGKSTVAKQMHILYLNGFGDQELAEYKQQVATNLVNNMRALLLGARKLGTPSSPPPSPLSIPTVVSTRAHSMHGGELLYSHAISGTLLVDFAFRHFIRVETRNPLHTIKFE